MCVMCYVIVEGGKLFLVCVVGKLCMQGQVVVGIFIMLVLDLVMLLWLLVVLVDGGGSSDVFKVEICFYNLVMGCVQVWLVMVDKGVVVFLVVVVGVSSVCVINLVKV